MKLYIDTETVGLNGPCKLVQYSVDRRGVEFIPLFRGWERDANTVERLVKLFCLLQSPDCTVVGFNLSFDLYHLYRVSHRLAGLHEESFERPVQPFKARTLDLYTHMVRTGPFAPWAFSRKTGKKVVAVRKVPKVAEAAVKEYVEDLLRSRVPDGVRVVPSRHAVKGRKDLITLSWCAAASLSLKAHAEHYLGQPAARIMDVWPLPPKEMEKTWLPYYEEADYAPYEDACEQVLVDALSPEPSEQGQLFLKYATDDIKYLWTVEDKNPGLVPDCHDASVEATAYTRYYGFPVDRASLEKTFSTYSEKVRAAESLLAGVNLKSSKDRLRKLREYDPIIGSSSKAVTAELAKEDSDVGRCAKAMREFGMYKQRLDQVIKVMESRTGRWHPDLRVMGTSTGRAAGTAGFNAQGIALVEDGIGLRAAILTPWGGDFASFEVAIAASAWKDQQLLEDLDSGTDVHLITAINVHPELVPLKLTYDEALRAKEDKKHPRYSLMKRCRTEIKRIVFGILYGAGAHKVSEVLSISEEEAQIVINKFYERYQGAGAFRAQEELRFCTADTETWKQGSVGQMANEASDITGQFTRSFRFEADVADALWRSARMPLELAEAIPEGTVLRSPEKGVQTIHGAVRSAFMGAAISIQRAVARAAINMPIQASGAILTKTLLAVLWLKYHIPMLNIHDELLAATHPNFIKFRDGLGDCVKNFIEEHKEKVKHIGFDAKATRCWADK